MCIQPCLAQYCKCPNKYQKLDHDLFFKTTLDQSQSGFRTDYGIEPHIYTKRNKMQGSDIEQ